MEGTRTIVLRIPNTEQSMHTGQTQPPVLSRGMLLPATQQSWRANQRERAGLCNTIRLTKLLALSCLMFILLVDWRARSGPQAPAQCQVGPRATCFYTGELPSALVGLCSTDAHGPWRYRHRSRRNSIGPHAGRVSEPGMQVRRSFMYNVLSKGHILDHLGNAPLACSRIGIALSTICQNHR